MPDCIYANLSGCSATDGWQMYCKEAAVPEGGGGGTGQPIPIEPIEECPTEYGTFAVDLLTGHSSIAFVTGCDNETIPSGLVDVMMTHPNGGMPMPWNVFAAQTGGIMPTGTVVQMSGDKYVIAWNAMLLGRTEAAYTATTGHRVACGIQHGGLEHPPVAVVVVNQQIAEVFFVHEPE
ncbi:MAG: hypothetical protein KF912_15130 [Phycisphaeraceae bacterium]|nr:hypothetical protein [Phycisphaeraceae bacterium]MBX3368640.1 hypothetical protein [Phycisphaeraceae bacterium]